MEYKAIMTQKAEDDLADILDYITETLLNKQAAFELVSELQDNIDILKKSPYVFASSMDPRLQAEGYHKFILKKSFIALFLIDDKKHEVSIMRIFYAKRNYPSLI